MTQTPKSKNLSSVDGSPKTPELCLLVVDDDDLDRRAIHRLLKHHYGLVEAETGQQAITLLQEQAPDCVLLDYQVPGTDTLMLLETCVQLHIPVVMLTGEGDETVAVESMKRGASDYLPKTLMTQNTLRHAVGNAIEKACLARLLRDKQQELESFVSTAAHDLRSPLRTVVMHCQLTDALAQDTLDAEARSALTTATDHALALVQLVDDLLEYTRVGRSAMTIEPTDMQALAVEVISSLDAVIGDSGGAVVMSALPTVRGDRTGLKQLLQNLIANGLKFRGEAPPRVQVTSTRHEGWWHIQITDNGIGIDPQYHERIFQPLTRLHAKDEYDGVGLGLAVCTKIVHGHGGDIWVSSEPGQGATFTFTLPATDG